MAATLNKVNVIIPTTCETRRWASLKRAISSVLSQENTFAELIVVVNGVRYNHECYEELSAMQNVSVAYQAEGSAPRAARLGRSLVTAPTFAFLDDDDEYLPDALSRRLEPLLADETLDYVASNGYRRIGDRDDLLLTDAEAIRRDPLRALASQNWLASCGGLYRSSSIPIEYFDEEATYFEWTLLAYKLASRLKMAFVEVPTFRIYDSPGSLSKSTAYREAEAVVLAKIASLGLPSDVKRLVQGKIGRRYHDLSNYSLMQGDYAAAWRYHLTSLRYRRGWEYLLYSRKLLPFYASKSH
jgi:glycosyltransferase involved in cell wall biosynthesis